MVSDSRAFTPQRAHQGGGSRRNFNPTDQFDLRQRRRESAERLLERASCLPAGDLTLLRAAFGDGRSGTELAALTGQKPRSVRRRIRRLAMRVMSQEYLFVLRHRESWSATRRRIATACVLHGQSLRQTSQELGISLYMVRRHYAAVVALYEAACGRAWSLGAGGGGGDGGGGGEKGE